MKLQVRYAKHRRRAGGAISGFESRLERERAFKKYESGAKEKNIVIIPRR